MTGQPAAATVDHTSSAERAWLALLIAGTALPWVARGAVVRRPRTRRQGLPTRRLRHRLGAFGWDVVVASGPLVVLALVEDELPVRSRVLVAIGAVGGSSVGRPMYLWLRTRHRRRG